MTEVLINSDNTGMVFVGEKLGFDRLYSYLRRYGLGEKSGLDGEEEQGGTLRGKEQYYPVERATITFGQGISVNALQLMRAWAALANGGFLVTPHLVEKIVGGGREVALSWPKSERVLSEATSRVVAEMLVRVTAESPVHYPWERVRELARFRIAAKSGTAQIAVGGKYQEKGTIASVIGFFPADSPKFLVMVKLNEPEVRPWGSDTAGPVFFSILRDLVAYYGLTP
jgi:cell division protein FtsI/penicillin-binding protein 2